MKTLFVFVLLLLVGCGYNPAYQAEGLVCGWVFKYEKQLSGDKSKCYLFTPSEQTAIMPERVNSCDAESFDSIYHGGELIYVYARSDYNTTNDVEMIKGTLVDCPK
jgi:hypothetical protein